MKHSSQRGYSLVELSIVLAIIAIVIAGAITGVQSILRSNNVVRTISVTNKAVASITAKLIRDADYANATLPVLTNPSMEIWEPKDITGAGLAAAKVVNPFGGQVWVNALNAVWNGTAINQAFIYTLTGIPAAACVDVALGLDTLALGVSVTNQLATAVVAAPQALAGTVLKQPGVNMTAATASAACSPVANTGFATIQLLVPRS